jgi:predicted RNase H-like HicB family nuclease
MNRQASDDIETDMRDAYDFSDEARGKYTAALRDDEEYTTRQYNTNGTFTETRVLRAGRESQMRTYTAVVEKCPDTGLYVGYVPGFPGAHTQAETLDELQTNLHEVIDMLLEDGEPVLEAEFIGTQLVAFA